MSEASANHRTRSALSAPAKLRRLRPALARGLAFSLAGRVLAGSEPGSKARQAEVTRAALMEINPKL